MSTVVMKYLGNTTLSTEGGTLNINPSGALTLKGHVAGVDLQAYSSKLADIAGLAPSAGDHIEWNGSNFVTATHSEEATTTSAPLVLTGSDISLTLDAGNLEVNGSNELAIKSGGVGTTELADASVTSGKIANGAVGTLALGDDAVTTEKISTNVQFDTASVVNGFTHNSAQSYADFRNISIASTTANATPSNVDLLNLADGSAYHFDVRVACKDQTSGDVACYTASFLAQRASAGSASIVSAHNIVIVHEDNAAMNLSFNANVNDIRAELTGSANSCRWSITVNATRVE